jgi:RNA polymerase sigma-B factor
MTERRGRSLAIDRSGDRRLTLITNPAPNHAPQTRGRAAARADRIDRRRGESNRRPASGEAGESGQRDGADWLDDAVGEFSQTRSRELRASIIERGAWLAKRVARRFAETSEPFDDLNQVAMIGLLKAVDRYDPAFGVRFGTFATPTILGELRRHFRDHTWSVHVPRGAKELRIQINAAIDDATADLGRSPTVDELARRLQISRDQVLEGLEAGAVYSSVSLEGLQGVEPTDETDNPTNNVLDRQLLVELLEHLPDREREILYLRYFQELSQAQIARRVGTSQVHVGRLIAASLTSMRELAEQRDERCVDPADEAATVARG